MKSTLLEITQEILSSMDSDEVNSITDTTESYQVALLVRRVYLDIASTLNLPEHFDFFKLNPSGDNTLPVVMYRPDDVDQLLWIKYDKRKAGTDPVSFGDVKYLEPTAFFNRMFMYNTNDPNVASTVLEIDNEDFTLIYYTDRSPNYWTSFDDATIIFDAYNSDLESTLQKTKTHCYGLKGTTFVMSDDFVPDLDSQQFSLLVNEAKSLAWAELKQTAHVKAERESRRQRVRAQKNKQGLPANTPFQNYHYNYPHYGRK